MFYMVVYEPEGYKPTYLIIDGTTLSLVLNPKRITAPMRFRLKEKCEETVRRMNQAIEDSFSENFAGDSLNC